MRLTADQQASYREQGFIHLSGFLTPAEAAAYRAEVHAIAATTAARDATWSSVKGGTQLTTSSSAPPLSPGCWSTSG